MIYINSKI